MIILTIIFWSFVVWFIFYPLQSNAKTQLWSQRFLFALGAVLLVSAPFLTGVYTQDVSLYIGGPYPYKVETITRSYTALFAGIAFIFFGLFALVRSGKNLSFSSPLQKALLLTFGLLVLRIFLEKLGVLLEAAMFFGIFWLIFPMGVYFGVEAAKNQSLKKFWQWLAGYAILTRLTVILVMLAATHFQLGTHFDNSAVTNFSAFGQSFQLASRSFEQYATLILAPQIVLWATATLLAGVVFGLPAFFIRARKQRSQQL